MRVPTNKQRIMLAGIALAIGAAPSVIAAQPITSGTARSRFESTPSLTTPLSPLVSARLGTGLASEHPSPSPADCSGVLQS